MQIIDLSKPIELNTNDPFFMRIKIKHKPHKMAKRLVRAFGLPTKLFPKKFSGWADDCIQKMGVHSTTHLDAPWHYAPTCAGKPAKTVDQIPLEWCYGPGVVIDMKHKIDFELITAADLQGFLSQESIALEPGMIVLIKTGRDKFMRDKDYFKRGTGMSVEATTWLIEQGIRVMGIDQWGWDIPLPHQIKEAKRTGQSELFWEAHLVGTAHEYCHMEQLINLDALPYSGFHVAAFPLKIKGGSAAPTRVVAIINE